MFASPMSGCEEGFREHGFRWPLHLDLGLDENGWPRSRAPATPWSSSWLPPGRPGFPRSAGAPLDLPAAISFSTALGAEARRAYLLAVSDATICTASLKWYTVRRSTGPAVRTR